MRKRRAVRGKTGRTSSIWLLLILFTIVGAAIGGYLGRRQFPRTPRATTPAASHASSPAPKSATRRAQHAPIHPSDNRQRPPYRCIRLPRLFRAHRRAGPAPWARWLACAAQAAKVALTFDAGASPAPTPAILKASSAAGVHVTFFLTGKFCEKNGALVKQIHDEGNEIGNHTCSHKDMRKLSDAEMADELTEWTASSSR